MHVRDLNGAANVGPRVRIVTCISYFIETSKWAIAYRIKVIQLPGLRLSGIATLSLKRKPVHMPIQPLPRDSVGHLRDISAAPASCRINIPRGAAAFFGVLDEQLQWSPLTEIINLNHNCLLSSLLIYLNNLTFFNTKITFFI